MASSEDAQALTQHPVPHAPQPATSTDPEQLPLGKCIAWPSSSVAPVSRRRTR